MKPSYPFETTGVLELVGKDEQIDNGDLSAAVSATTIKASVEFTRFMFYMTEEKADGGDILYPAGYLLIFTADPGHSSGETGSNITAAMWQTCVGIVKVTAGDWMQETNAAVADIKDQLIQVHGCGTLYFVWLHADATSINSVAADDEVLDFQAWYLRYS